MLIPGFETYEMSEEYPHDVTHVKSGRVLKWTLTREGYYTASLYKDGRGHTMGRGRLIAHCFIPNPEGKPTVDHVNRDRIDDRMDNLRWATWEEQRGNQAPHKVYKMLKNNTSGIKGVHWFKRAAKWQAKIEVNGTTLHLGLFDDINDADAAYRAKRRELGRE